MSAPDSSAVGKIIGSIGLVLSYGIALWRIFRRSHGDRFIEFGIATMFVFDCAGGLAQDSEHSRVGQYGFIFPALFIVCGLDLVPLATGISRFSPSQGS